MYCLIIYANLDPQPGKLEQIFKILCHHDSKLTINLSKDIFPKGNCQQEASLLRIYGREALAIVPMPHLL
jgi:hypothetical protein